MGRTLGLEEDGLDARFFKGVPISLDPIVETLSLGRADAQPDQMHALVKRLRVGHLIKEPHLVSAEEDRLTDRMNKLLERCID